MVTLSMELKSDVDRQLSWACVRQCETAPAITADWDVSTEDTESLYNFASRKL